jgi:hypothetical protein
MSKMSDCHELEEVSEPKCSSCASTKVTADASWVESFISCLACGYTIETTFISDKMPPHLRGSMSDEAMAVLDAPENWDTKIFVVPVTGSEETETKEEEE